jgi:hypothetical protein
MVMVVICIVDVTQTPPVVDLVVTHMVTVLLVDRPCILPLNQDLLVMLVELLLLQEQRCSLMNTALSVALVTLVPSLVAVVMAPATTTAAVIKLVMVVLVSSALDLNKENNGKVWFNASGSKRLLF